MYNNKIKNSVTVAELVAKFGVSVETISSIVR